MRRLGGRLREVATYKSRTELGGGRVLLGKSQDISALWKITSLTFILHNFHITYSKHKDQTMCHYSAYKRLKTMEN